MMDGGAERGGNDGWTAREGPPGRENGNSVRLMDGWDGMDGWIDGKESFPNQTLPRSENTAEKDQKPQRWTPQRSIPKKTWPW